MPLDRSYPPGWASVEKWYRANFDASEKVVVYWPRTSSTSAAPTLVAYYDTVSAANTAATAAISGQRKPRVFVNFWHSDFTHLPVGWETHRKANDANGAIDLPAWYDEEPAS